ncbi:response regulator [Lyngbya sp. CCY1209]|nr:response regulator [Lyngbya sp. CCY1209]
MDRPKILIVEDEFLIAKGLARKLEKLGYEVVDIVASGMEAIARTLELKPDLILMDIVIEGEFDGIETAAKIHEICSIPIIYLTAYADDQTLERAQETQSYGYILKPFKERELHAAIKMAIGKHKKDREIAGLLSQAENQNQEKSRYLNRASHDLRNPMTVIQVSAGILKDYGNRLPEEKKQQHLDWIRVSVKTMNEILEDVLILSQAEAGKQRLNPQSINVIAFSHDILQEFHPLATDKHTCQFVSRGEECFVNLDVKLLRYILTNLLSNAIKYSPEGGEICLEVTCESDRVCFQIRDRGIGIPPEYRHKLFKQFERADNVGDIKGTGLGLSIVKHAVDLQGGTIDIESQVGVGTTVSVTLPTAGFCQN